MGKYKRNFSLHAKLGAVSLTTLLFACGQQPPAAEGMGAMQPAAVEVRTMQAQTVPFAIELPATLSGSKEVEIRARVAGIIESRNFEEGDKVEQGQSLFTLDLKPFDVEVARTQADLLATKARLESARRDVKRLTPLRKQNSVSQQDLDNAISAEEVALADVKAAEARLQDAKLSLEYAKVESPVNGIAGREQVSEGTYVPGPDVLLTQVTQLDPIRIRFGLSEREQLAMRKDVESGKLTLPQDGHWQTRIKLQDGSFYEHIGEVNFRDVRINTMTGTSELQAIVPNPDFKLRPGQFVRVVLEGASRDNAFVVPQRAVLDSGTGKYVYLFAKGEQGNIAQPAPVEVGEWVRLQTPQGIENGWVVHKGLKGGDQVIVEGMAHIFFPGMPVVLAGQPSSSAQ
ncbi:efflux RND transporter periplasmic adaptor subunit [Bowmanella pacifica]|uniref:MexE family multidrug efflux RND transporter periplasmic adaptor subunit n=1 Tax=Bowmanella pacifica TaxID=502051 RepID=A0A918DHH0_9ALTE|nr:efflux RND transporter periplasmic adaptor subunit [Bowmanella pacifica]GGO66481.1 MexE family multidrug efflux RND transporter periplasmic adaptor subunit [Bowmanella pacifica]